ncbi:DUF2231 domain-containing protein [Aerosakkonema sp. BLCC-F183]|uniref:DUF2231 domain-containing protein n=1 Tax=Aerosakkonema sp. BLCC-F183 TaxID=3342834 RepID=UPI0035B6DAAA
MNAELVQQLIDQLGLKIGANRLPYEIPIHPNLVHFTLGLLIIAIIFDIAGMLFALEKPIFNFLGLTAIRQGFFDVGWYNLVAAAIVTFFTVAAGFFELILADPPTNIKSDWGLGAGPTMLLHGLGGVFLLAIIVAMTVWRGFQRYHSRKSAAKEVHWSYLIAGILLLGILYLHGTLGAQLGDNFGVHNTAAHLLRQGKNPNSILK